MADVAQRNARLDALQTATQDWAAKRRKELTLRVTTGKTILQGRTGSERLAQSAVQAAQGLVVDELSQFIST